MVTKTAKKVAPKKRVPRKVTPVSEVPKPEPVEVEKPARKSAARKAPAKKVAAKKTSARPAAKKTAPKRPAGKATPKKEVGKASSSKKDGRSTWREYDQHGFMIGSHMSKIADLLVEGGDSREAIVKKATKAIGNTNRNGGDRNVAGMVGLTLRRMVSNGAKVEQSFKVVPKAPRKSR